jgi:uncharacterized membrane protein
MGPTLRQPTEGALPGALPRPNLGDTERLISGVLGAVAVLRGLRQGGATGGLALLTGAALLGRSVSGYCPITAAARAKPVERRIAQEHGWTSAAIASASVTIACDAEEVHRFVRDPANVAKYMGYVDRVEPRDNGLLWHWTAHVPGFGAVEWDSRITEDRTGELFAWESQPGAALSIAGRTEFRRAPGGRGTEVHMRLDIQPPGGALGATLARLAHQGIGWQASSDLRRLKQLLETGEIPTPALRRVDAPAVASS